MIWFWVVAWVITFGALLGALWKIADMGEEARSDDLAEHAKCIAHIASVTSNRFVADRLRQLAEKWDSIEEQANLKQLARERYKPGGPSMPRIWLRQQAELLDPTEIDFNEVAEYNLAGERLL